MIEKKHAVTFLLAGIALLLCLSFAACKDETSVESGPKGRLTPITAGDLSYVVDAPQTGGTPQTADIDAGSQYSLGGIQWFKTADGAYQEGAFAANVGYTFSAIVIPKPGCTLTGMNGNFTHTEALDVTCNNGMLVIRFKPTGGTGGGTTVVNQNLNLTGFITAPVLNNAPVNTVSGTAAQFTFGTLVWTYTDGTAMGSVFAANKEIKAAVTLTPKTGFSFNGLAANAFSHSGAANVVFTPGAGGSINITITFAALSASPASYTVTFETYGGSYVNSVTRAPGGTIPRPANPTRYGYNFDNWYTNSSFTSLFNFSAGLTASAVVHARWTANSSQATDTRAKITSAKAYPIRNPVAGNYPQGLFKFPYSGMANSREEYVQTLEWVPAVTTTFAAGTVYTAKFIFEPRVYAERAINTLTLANISGLPSGSGVTSVTGESKPEAFIVTVTYNATAAAKGPRQTIFEDEFDGSVLNTAKWGRSNQEDRQGLSTWKDDMSTVSGGQLNIAFRKDPNASTNTGNHGNANWIRAGGVQTTKLYSGSGPGSWGQLTEVLFESSYGYFEARVKYPRHTSGKNIPWGGFWLFSRTVGNSPYNGTMGTEIDILETIANGTSGFNSALHWNGYGNEHKSVGRYNDGSPPGGSGPFTAINIYDGNFHTHAVEWTPGSYKFYVDGILFWEVPEGYADWWDGENRTVNISQNPAYIMFTVEAASWQNSPAGWPSGWTQDKMEVQWVKVWNQPPQ
jgi:hypothetical protein